jgi:hypothetical protein
MNPILYTSGFAGRQEATSKPRAIITPAIVENLLIIFKSSLFLSLPGRLPPTLNAQKGGHLPHRPRQFDPDPQPLPYRSSAHVVESQLP